MDSKKKNLLDLEYSAYLTYLQVVIVLIGTSFVTLIIGTLPRWNTKSLTGVVIIVISIMIVVWIGFYNKLKKIKSCIEDLPT